MDTEFRRMMHKELKDCNDDFLAMRERAETAEAALAQCQHDLAEVIERKEFFRQVWEQAESALAERYKPCMWCRAADGFFDAGCGVEPYTTRAPKFCPYCGHRIEVAP